MRFIESLCPPALIYLLYTAVHIGLDLSLGMFTTAAIKSVMAVAGVVILDSLCGVELGIVAWAVVATPFIMVALASSISLGLGIDRMVSNAVKEKFTPLTGDNLKDRGKTVSVLAGADELPLSTDNLL